MIWFARKRLDKDLRGPGSEVLLLGTELLQVKDFHQESCDCVIQGANEQHFVDKC